MDKILSNSKKEEKRCKSVVILTFIFNPTEILLVSHCCHFCRNLPGDQPRNRYRLVESNMQMKYFASTKNVFIGFKSVLTYCYSYLSSSFVNNVGHSAYNTTRFRSQEDEGKYRFKYRKKKEKKRIILFSILKNIKENEEEYSP